jgi:hypothetical protein
MYDQALEEACSALETLQCKDEKKAGLGRELEKQRIKCLKLLDEIES